MPKGMASTAVVRGELDLNSRKFEAGISRAQQQIKSLESTARRLGTLTFFAGGAAIVSTTRTIIEFQREMARTGALVDANASEFQALTDKARELGSSTLFSAKEAAGGFAFLAQAGFETNEILDTSEDFLNLAAAASLDLATTMDIASNIMQGFGLEAESSGRAVDVLSNIAASSNTNVLDLGEAMKQIGPVAAAGSVGIEDAAAAVGLLANAGIKGSLSGTSLRNIILRLSDPTSEAKKAIDALGLTIGELNPASNSLVDIFTRIKSGMDGASDSAMALGAASDIFGLRAAASGLVLSSNVDELKNLTEANKEADGTTKKLADRIQDNLDGAFKILRSRLDELKLSIEEGGFGDALRKAVDDASESLEGFVNSGQAEDLGKNLADGLKSVVAAFRNLISVVGDATKFANENKDALIGLGKAVTGLYIGIKSLQFASFIAGLAKTTVMLAGSTAGLFANTSALNANTAAKAANTAADNLSAGARQRLFTTFETASSRMRKTYSKNGKAAARFWEFAAPTTAGLATSAALPLVVGVGLIKKATEDIKAANAEMDDLEEATFGVNSALSESRGAEGKLQEDKARVKLLKQQEVINENIRNGVDKTEEGRNLQKAQLKAIGKELEKHDEAEKEKKKLLAEEVEAREKIHKLHDSVPLARAHDIQKGISEETERQRRALEASPSLNHEKQLEALEKRKKAFDKLKSSKQELESLSVDLGLGLNVPREMEEFLRETRALVLRGDFADDATASLKKTAELVQRIEEANPDWGFEKVQESAKKLLSLSKDIQSVATSTQFVRPDETVRAARILDIVKSMEGFGHLRYALAEDLLDIEAERNELTEEAAAKKIKSDKTAKRLAQEELTLLRAKAGLGGDAEVIKLAQDEGNLAREIAEAQGIAGQEAIKQAKEKLKLEAEVTKQKEAQKEADNIAKKTAEIAEKALNEQISSINSLINNLDDRADALPAEIRANNGDRSIKGRARNDARREQQVEIDKLQSQADLASSKLKELKKSTSGTNTEIQATERELRNLQSSLEAAANAAGASKTGGTAVKGNRASLTGRAVGKGKLVGGEGKRVEEARVELLKAQKAALEESRQEAEAQAEAEKAALQEKVNKQAEAIALELQILNEKSAAQKVQQEAQQAARESDSTGGGTAGGGTSAFSEAAKSICECIGAMGDQIASAVAAQGTGGIASDVEKIREYFDDLNPI